jgi:hypothetical protein
VTSGRPAQPTVPDPGTPRRPDPRDVPRRTPLVARPVAADRPANGDDGSTAHEPAGGDRRP